MQLTPRLRRVWFRTDDLSAFADSRFTDRYVKLVFPKPGVDYPHFDIRKLRGIIPAHDLPVVRTYTALFPDLEERTLAIDFVVHGDEGTASPWGARRPKATRSSSTGRAAATSPTLRRTGICSWVTRRRSRPSGPR